MKKIFTFSLITLFILSASLNLFSQSQPECIPCNDKEYAKKKAEFWKEYQIYKSNLDKNIVTSKPIDPNGLFVIDEHNNFAVKNSINPINERQFVGAPWKNGFPDAVNTGYFFSQSTTSYTTISGTGTLLNSNCDDGYNSSVAIGFSFNYNGTAYTTISSSCNGWIMMGAGTPSGYSPIATGSYANAIAPFAGDLYGLASGNGMYYQTTGSAPNRVFTIEWYHWGFFSNGGLNEMNFQIKLFETTNIIQFVYQPTTPTYSYSMQTGIMGATNADYNTRTTTTNWAATTIGAAASYMTYSSSIYPSNGLTFYWLPVPTTFPNYYNYNTTVGGNSFPFGVAAGKEVQWLVKAGEFNQPGSAISGLITSLSFYMAAAGAPTYTTFTIKLAQDTISNLPTGVIYTGPLQTVFFSPSVAFTSAAATWMNIPITPFTYDNTKNLIIDVSQCLATVATSTINQTTLTGIRRTYINETSCVPSYGGQDATVGNLGINVISTTPPGPMGYASSNTIQLNQYALNVGNPILPGSLNNQIIKIQIVDTQSLSPFLISRFRLETTGSNNPAVDIAAAKLWYTRSVNTFSMTRQYGSTVAGPNGVFNITALDTVTLDPNATNYFWLTYDLTPGAVWPDSVDAQCDSIIGTSPMGGQVPTTIAPAGSSPIDPYCRGQVSNNGCSTNMSISNVTFGSINNTTGCNPNLPFVYTPYPTLTTTVRQNNQYPINCSVPAYGNPTLFGIWIDWNNNNSFAEVNEYTQPPPVTSALTNPTTGIVIVPTGATLGNHRMRVRSSYASSLPVTQSGYCATLLYGEQEDYVVNVVADTNMYYASSTTTQSSVANIFTPSNNTQIIGMQVVTAGTISPITASSFTFNTVGTSHPNLDITTAKLWYTGLSSTFATTTQYGVSVGPSGSFIISNGSFPALAQGVNYFWLTYDIPASAPNGDTVDAQCNSITIGGVPRTPTVTSPAGFRIIQGNALCGTYNIPGNYPSIAAAITDLNTRGTPLCAVTYNIAAGWTEVAANLTISATGTVSAPITFRKNGTGDNPRIVAAPGTGSYDGIIKFNGVNYITFDGIDVSDTSSNTTVATQMEWGYALLRLDATHGSQFITIKNCNIKLNKTNTSTHGIHSYYQLVTGGTLAPTASSGTNSNNTFLNVNITNSYYGMYLYGYPDSQTPYALGDNNNMLSTTGGGRSSITDFGGGAGTAYGIYSYYQSNVTLSNTLITNRAGTGTGHTGSLYGIYNYSYYNKGNATISGDTVTLVDTTSATGNLYAIYHMTYNGQDNYIMNNVVRDCVNLTQSTYYNEYFYIYNASGSMLYQNSFTITGNKCIGNSQGVAAVTTGSGTSTYDFYFYDYCNSFKNVSNNLDSGNTVLGTTAYTGYVLYSPGVANNVVNSNNRVVNNTFCGTTASGTIYGIYEAGGYYTCSMDSNVVANNNFPSNTTISFYNMYNASPAPTSDYSYNTVTGNTSSGSGTFYGMYFAGSPLFGSTINYTNNTITNLSKTTATGIGSIYGLYSGSSGQGTINILNNTITGFTSAAATTIYGLYQIGSPPNYLNINNNKVGNFNVAGAGTIYGIYNNPTASTVNTMTQDSVFNLISAGGTIYGMYSVNGNPVTIYRNKISGITSTTGTSVSVYGMYIGGGTVNYVYDNFISDINAPASTTYASPAVTGLYIGAGTFDYVYYNTIYLKDTSTSATSFGTAGIYASTSPNLDLRNNVVINNSYPGPTLGNVVAYWRSANSLPTYLTTSNNNCFYAGTPAANKLVFYDGTNLIQTLSAYKTFVLSRDNNSVTELPPFVNIATIPYDLRIQTAVGTQLESGGQIISTSGFPAAPINITQDAFGTSRYPNAGYPIGAYTPMAPDIGAHEFGGVNTDNIPPFISYTPLGNGSTANRPFTNVIITDQSGVNVSGPTRPRCYYKRSTDGNVINDSTNTTDGWKYVLSNGITSPFDFTIDYSKLNGGTGVSAGNIIQYFVIAQDLVSTPNVGAVQATFATAPTADSLVSANAPITNTLTYTIGSTSFSGNYNVGTAQTYTSLTGVNGIFAAINSSNVSGNVTITITSNLYEDGTNALNATSETGVGGYTIKIVPATAALYTITGSVAQGMIRLNGAQRVIIDGGSFFSSDNPKWGYNSGNEPLTPGKYLTIRNNNISNPAITFINGAVNDTIKYCTVESNNYAGTSSGTIFFSTTTSLVTGNSNNVITNCDIRDNDSVTTSPTYSNGIYSLGTSTAYALYNTNNTIKNCNFYNNYYDIATTTAAIYMTSGTNSWIIQNNSFYQTVPRTLASSETICGIFNAATSAYGHQIIGNYFGGSAPLCGGSPMTYTGAGLYTIYGIQLTVGAVTPSSIQGNVIQNINLTESPASGSAVFFRGITVPTSLANVNIGNITGNTIGSGTGNGSITLTVNTTVTGYSGPICGIFSNGIGNISNNTVGSITVGGNAAATSIYAVQGIQWTSTTQNWTYNCNNNLVGSLTTPNSIQFTDSLSACQLRGIVCGNGLVTIDNFTNNTVANLTNYSQACATITIASIVYGFSFSTAGNFTITNNNIFNLSLNTSAGLATFPATYLVIGISHSSQGINVINQNNIHSLYFNNPTATGSGLNTGIFVGGETGTTVSRNKVYDMRYSSIVTTTSIMLSGISCASTAPGVMTISNNMICITNGDPLDNPFNKLYKEEILTHENINVPLIKQKIPESLLLKNKKVIVGYDPDAKVAEPLLSQARVNDKNGNPTNRVNITGKNVQQNVNSAFTASIAGILTQVGSGVPPAPNTNFFYNTVYIGGTDAGASSSWGFLKQFYGNLTVRNNLLINARTGAANHYAIGNEASPPANSWSATTSTYNTFIGPSDATIGEWGTANATTLAGWVAASGGDNQSYSSNTSNINPANLLTNISTCDLRIVSANSSAWIISGKGIALAGQGIDYEGTPRSTTITAGVTDIGADEFVATPPSNPVATQTGTPGAGSTTTYFLYGRKLCSIDWGIGGTSYPTSMSVNYYSGINPPNNSTLGPNYSNSYWTVVPTGSLSGTTYNVTFFFGDNETFTITSPSTNTILANSNNTYWQAFPPGSAPLQSNLNWSILTLSPTLLSSINFSTYALADGSLTPSLIYPPYNALSMPTTDTLSWTSNPGVVTYHVQLGTDSTFASGFIVNDSTVVTTSRIVSGLSNNITYFWRVRSKFGTYNGPFDAPYKFRTSSGVASVSVTVIPGGFYSAGQLNMKDTIRIVLVDSASCTKIDSSKVLLDSVTFSATPTPTFVNAATGKYYIYVYHRNHLTISSMYTQNVIRGSNVSYDFTTDSSKTYGFNVVKVSTSPVKWGMIPGDANQDGYVDGLDQTIWVAENGANGYFGADFNGDTYVDGLDQTIWVGTNGSGTNLPCYFSIVTLPGPGKQNGQPTRVIINRGNINNNVNKAIRENQKNQKQ
jgi:hypothetical protein